MQAGLKCDRVPQKRLRGRRVPHIAPSSAEKKGPFCNKMAGKEPMQPTADFDASRLSRSLLRRSRQGALATLMAGSGDPYCSLVNVASHADGSPILLISRLALHTKNILADGRVSLMLDERAAGDPLEGARIMLAGPGRGGRGRDREGPAPALPQCPSVRGSVRGLQGFLVLPDRAGRPASGCRLWPHHRPRARAVSDRDRRCRRDCWRPSRARSNT